MIYYHVVSCVNNDGTLFQVYRNKKKCNENGVEKI